MSQTAFAGLAGVTKSAQIKWEGGATSAPTAPALAAWAEAGADVLYILTSRRTPYQGYGAATQIDEQLAGIRRDLLDPSHRKLPGELPEATEAKALEGAAAQLSAMLRYDTSFMTPEVREEVEHLLAVATQPANLTLYRAADFAQNRAKRREIKDRLADWLDGRPYVPSDAVMNLLTALALDYAVPIKMLVELVEEMQDDVRQRDPLDLGQMEPQR